MTLFVVNMPPSAQRIGFGVPKASFPRAETAPSAQWFGFRVPKLTFPRSNTASSAQRIGFGVSRATSSACHAASAHAPHFGTHRNPHPGTHRNANPGGYRNANPGTHRDAGPRVPPAKQQVDESAEEPPHFGTPLNSNPGTHRNAGGPDVSQSRRHVERARSLCQPTRRISHNIPCPTQLLVVRVCQRPRPRGTRVISSVACRGRHFVLAHAASDTTFSVLCVPCGISAADTPLLTQQSVIHRACW